MSPLAPKQRALTELFVAPVIWGFAFITTVWALEGIGPIWMTSVRFVMAVVMLDLLHRSGIAGLKPLRYSLKGWLACLWPGFFLFGILAFQTWGLKYTTATKCGFITVLYILILPFLERIFLKRRIPPTVWLWIALAIVGTSLICGAITSTGIAPDFLSAFNIGDGLTLLCAFCSAGHLMVVNHGMAGTRDSGSEVAAELAASPVKFHVYQCIWIVIFAALAGSLVEGFGWVPTLLSGGWNLSVWLSLAQLGFLSSGIAFLIQVRAQRVLSPTTVGLMILLESPWAMGFSVWLLDEYLTPFQLLGAGLILIASISECIQQSKTPSVRAD